MTTAQYPLFIVRWISNIGLTLGLFCALLSGCMVGPNYHAPSAPTAPAYKETAPTSAVAVPVAGAWWQVFNDATLNDLETQAVTANPDIQIAVAHVDQADAVRRSIHSFQLPTVTAGPSGSRTREAQQRPNNGNTNGHAATYNDFQLPLSLGYEIDAWGRIRRMVQSATASQQATEADLRFVRLSVAASVATDYYTVREPDAETKILETTIVDLERGYEITNNQFRRGLISELAVRQAQTILDQTRAHIEAFHIQRSQSEHAIAVLLGRPVAGSSIAEAFTLPLPPALRRSPATGTMRDSSATWTSSTRNRHCSPTRRSQHRCRANELRRLLL